MKNSKIIFSLLLLTVIHFNNCNLISNVEIQILDGYVIDNKTELPLEGVTVLLVEMRWEDVNLSILQETQTDENGHYSFDIEASKDYFEGGNYGVGLPNYITPEVRNLQSYAIITVNGKEYNYAQTPRHGVRTYRPNVDMTFRLRPSAYFKVHFKNINPIDENDLVKFSRTDQFTLEMRGMDVDTAVITRRWLYECDDPLLWQVTKANYSYYKSLEDQCCADGDTCLIEAFY